MDKFIVKYGTEDNLIKGAYYEIYFEYSKCLRVDPIDNRSYLDESKFLEFIDCQFIDMQYVDKSRIDRMNVFILYPIQIKRKLKLDQIL